VFLGRDFNCATTNLDRGTGALLPGDILYNRCLKEFFEPLNLEDMFRKVHPNEQSFTYHSGLRRSRIDKIYGNFNNNVESAQHIPLVFSDHQAVCLNQNQRKTKDWKRILEIKYKPAW
jgi:hypothetical protein